MKEEKKILIVEDDTDINNLLFTALKKQGYTATQAFSGTEAKMLLKMESFALVLLDLMLPGISGEEVLEFIKEQGNSAVIILTAKDTLDDKVNLLIAGADDYITKPYSLKELAAPVYAQVRRSVMQGFIIDHHQQSLTAGNHVIPLSQKEFDLFLYLLGNPGRILTPDELYREVWRTGKPDTTNSVAVHIARLRRKLDEVGHLVGSIETVRGEGYEFQPRSEARTRL